jgi:hypothetical protein
MTGAKSAEATDDIKAVRHKSTFYKNKQSKPQKHTKQRNCMYCGKQCTKGKCPAYGKTCDRCGKLNHFASQCRQNKNKSKGRHPDHIRQFNTNSSDESDTDFEIMTVETHDVNIIQNKLFAHMLLIDDKREVKFQLDSGATANFIPKSYLSESTEIENSDHTLTTYNQSTMRSYGTCILRLKNPKTHKRYKVKFIVVDDKYTPLLGEKVIQAMNLITIQFQNNMVCDNSHNTADISTMKNIVLEYSDIFEGEGNFQEALKLEIDESIPPVKSPLRRIPLALKPKFKNEIQRLEKLGVIKPVLQTGFRA